MNQTPPGHASHPEPEPTGTPRRIRSFVLRGGRMGSGQQRALAELGPRFVLPCADAPLDPAAVFGRDAPLVLEIGFGMGDATAEVVERFAATVDIPVRFTTQQHEGFRLARVRNNAARLARGDYLLFLDGDCILPRDHLAAHRARRRPGLALLGHCARLPEETSRLLVPDNLSVMNLAGLVPAAEIRALARRHRRARWHNLLRHPTKPRLTGGDFGIWRADFERVNGFDERFVGWGQEDDDLGLRLRAAGLRLESVLDLTRSLHVWHPTDPTATPRWRDGANVAYFERRGRLTVCRDGLHRRGRRDLVWGLPNDLGASELGRRVACQLASAPLRAQSQPLYAGTTPPSLGIHYEYPPTYNNGPT
jgi:hypothetical protein